MSPPNITPEQNRSLQQAHKKSIRIDIIEKQVRDKTAEIATLQQDIDQLRLDKDQILLDMEGDLVDIRLIDTSVRP